MDISEKQKKKIQVNLNRIMICKIRMDLEKDSIQKEGIRIARLLGFEKDQIITIPEHPSTYRGRRMKVISASLGLYMAPEAKLQIVLKVMGAILPKNSDRPTDLVSSFNVILQ